MAILAACALIVSCASTDAGLTTKIKSMYAADDTVKAVQIDVDTKDRVVTLTGNVDTQQQKDRAIELAQATKGVARVVDMISVKTAENTGEAPDTNRTVGQTLDDAGITMKVKGKFLEDPDVKGLQIDVDTREGVVYLTGSVKSENEKEKAVRLARETDGVRDVQANLSIRG
ncbi:MAG TPA: BON domain-containing protein [Candidatus Polarisedimenticolaceae bacterium]|nr:BON domain-containing protein [Candidatus Polarisedimenticolaceae bacterium]